MAKGLQTIDIRGVNILNGKSQDYVYGKESLRILGKLQHYLRREKKGKR